MSSEPILDEVLEQLAADRWLYHLTRKVLSPIGPPPHPEVRVADLARALIEARGALRFYAAYETWIPRPLGRRKAGHVTTEQWGGGSIPAESDGGKRARALLPKPAGS